MTDSLTNSNASASMDAPASWPSSQPRAVSRPDLNDPRILLLELTPACWSILRPHRLPVPLLACRPAARYTVDLRHSLVRRTDLTRVAAAEVIARTVEPECARRIDKQRVSRKAVAP